MKNIIILFAMFLASEAIAVCTTPISRTNFSPLTKLDSSKLNADFNALYTQVNEFPGDCITDETITSDKIKDGTIVNADIANATITTAKLAAMNYQLSPSSGSVIVSSGTFSDITNLSVSITSLGRPIEISLISDTGNGCRINTNTTGVFASVDFRILKNGVALSDHALYLSTVNDEDIQGSIPGTSIRHIDFASAGSYTYKLQGKGSGAIYDCKLLAREL